jgi:Cu-Zn family superoxide dismutase
VNRNPRKKDLMMRVLFSTSLALFSFPVLAAWPSTAKPIGRAVLQPKSGSTAGGTVDFAVDKGSLLIKADLSGIAPGRHGLHIHEKGDCTAADASSAGAHYNPTGAKHGGPTSPSHHAGDFGNVVADDAGRVHYEAKLFAPTRGFNWDEIVGRSMVLHEKRDDLKTQPSGDSGKRIACGVILRSPGLSE